LNAPPYIHYEFGVAISAILYQISATLIERYDLMSGFVQQRITDEEALDLLQHAPTAELMARADAIRRARHGNKTYYVHSHNLNPTNLCVVKCKLCSFWRPENAHA
jgi:2-iminoacetate synthase ThiH